MPVAAVDPLALGLLASNLKTVWSTEAIWSRPRLRRCQWGDS
jgi:hypothetical protein